MAADTDRVAGDTAFVNLPQMFVPHATLLRGSKPRMCLESFQNAVMDCCFGIRTLSLWGVRNPGFFNPNGSPQRQREKCL